MSQMNLTNLTFNLTRKEGIKHGFEKGFQAGAEKYGSLIILVLSTYFIEFAFRFAIGRYVSREIYDIEYIKSTLNSFFVIVRIAVLISLAIGKVFFFKI